MQEPQAEIPSKTVVVPGIDHAFPRCDCNYGCKTCRTAAVFQVARKGKLLNLCSRCDLSGDKRIGRYFTEADVPAIGTLDAAAYGLAEASNVWDDVMNMFGGREGCFIRDLEKLPLLEVPRG